MALFALIAALVVNAGVGWEDVKDAAMEALDEELHSVNAKLSDLEALVQELIESNLMTQHHRSLQLTEESTGKQPRAKSRAPRRKLVRWRHVKSAVKAAASSKLSPVTARLGGLHTSLNHVVSYLRDPCAGVTCPNSGSDCFPRNAAHECIDCDAYVGKDCECPGPCVGITCSNEYRCNIDIGDNDFKCIACEGSISGGRV